MPAALKARLMQSFKAWCIIIIITQRCSLLLSVYDGLFVCPLWNSKNTPSLEHTWNILIFSLPITRQPDVASQCAHGCGLLSEFFDLLLLLSLLSEQIFLFTSLLKFYLKMCMFLFAQGMHILCICYIVHIAACMHISDEMVPLYCCAL